MINRGHDLPVTKQAAALKISRGSVYYLEKAGIEKNCNLRIQERNQHEHGGDYRD